MMVAARKLATKATPETVFAEQLQLHPEEATKKSTTDLQRETQHRDAASMKCERIASEDRELPLTEYLPAANGSKTT